jgi:cytochrome c553
MRPIAILILALGAVANAQAEGKPEKLQVCAACHGETGNEAKVPGAPKLAGQYPDYLYHSLKDYKAGRRKNAIMNGQAQALSDKEMRQLAEYFASQGGSLKVIR